jgi:beta-lactamase regulating signal transducer with metallopeptidase domain
MSILVTWLWQGLVVAAAAAVLLRCVPRASADTRHAACWATLAAVVCIPIALVAVRAVAAESPETAVSYADVADAGAAGAGAIVLPAVPSWVGVACVVAWMLTSAAGLVRLARRWRAARHLARRSSPFDACREAGLPLWSRARTTARRLAELRVSDDLGGACAIGFRRPMILVGRRLEAALDDRALDLIVLHEQAHLARRDDVLQMVQAGVLAVAGWHPAVWWLSRRIDLEREAACDDYVLARSAAARQYAAALLQAAAAHGSGSPAIALSAAKRPSALRERVGRLFDADRRRGGPHPLVAFVLTLPMAAVAGAPRLAALVVFGERAELHVVEAASAPRAVISSAELTRRPEPASTEQGGPERIGSASSQEAPPDAVPTIAARPRIPVGLGVNSSPPSLKPRAHVRDVLPTARRASAVLGMTARAPDPQPSPLVDTLAPAAPASRGPWTSLAESSSGAARVTVTAVGGGATKTGLSLGRAFTRAGKAVAGTF